MKYIGLIGSRKRNTLRDKMLMRKAFEEIYEEGDAIVSGGCPSGGDKFADDFAEELGLKGTDKYVLHPAEWTKFGKGAGYIRNTYIAQDSDVLIALVTGKGNGGADDTVRKAKKMGKQVIELEPVEIDFDPELDMEL